MEFHEKLQELRKSRGLTQEELAEELYVSRTAISKWESGRGYPSIDSLKEISNYFSVTIDELLSTDKLLSIAEKENRANLRGMCDLLFGLLDVFAIVLIVFSSLWGTNLLRFLCVSLLLWGVIISVTLSTPIENIWYVCEIGAVGQFMIVLWFSLVHLARKRKNKQ